MNQKILDVVERHCKYFKDNWGDDLWLTAGPGHIVYDDYNIEHESVRFCIEQAKNLSLTDSWWCGLWEELRQPLYCKVLSIL